MRPMRLPIECAGLMNSRAARGSAVAKAAAPIVSCRAKIRVEPADASPAIGQRVPEQAQADHDDHQHRDRRMQDGR